MEKLRALATDTKTRLLLVIDNSFVTASEKQLVRHFVDGDYEIALSYLQAQIANRTPIPLRAKKPFNKMKRKELTDYYVEVDRARSPMIRAKAQLLVLLNKPEILAEERTEVVDNLHAYSLEEIVSKSKEIYDLITERNQTSAA